MRPFFPYYGSKWNIARYYPRPTRDLVVEPFAGSAAYSTFYDCRRVTLFDADAIICGVWDFLIRVTPSEVSALPDIAGVGDSVDNYAIPQEAKWLIGFWLNRGSATPKKTRTAYSARTDKGQLNWGPRAKERIVGQLPAIREWTIINQGYDKAPDCEATWFVDPPYGDKGRYYRVQFADFESLGKWCASRCGQLIVCEGPGASWLPFVELGSYKSSKGRALEMVYLSEKAA